MKILIGCEESQAVTIEFRKLGFEAYSCDLQECSGEHPEWHIKGDLLNYLPKKGGMLNKQVWFQNGDRKFIDKWDMGIFFPECTYLTVSANKWYKDQPERESGTLVGEKRRDAREKGIEFFMGLYNCDIPRIAIENPIGIMSSRFRKPNQVLQPWMFGHGETKATCLWLKGLPQLKPTNIVSGREQRIHKLPKTKDRAKLRSKTYPGIAKAMAEQWGSYITKPLYESFFQDL